MKLDFYSEKCILVRYVYYSFYDPKKNDVIISRDIIFNELNTGLFMQVTLSLTLNKNVTEGLRLPS